MPVTSEVFRRRPALSIALGRDVGGSGGGEWQVGLPCLGGETREEIFEGARSCGSGRDGMELFDGGGGVLLGHARVVLAGDGVDVAEETRRLYGRIFAACGDRHLYRLWNYVPRINEEVEGLENYRAFCRGRSQAFEAAFGRGFQGRLPAASGVGSDGGALEVIFAAGAELPRHVENPAQVPAYEYPAEYGPRSPSFSRATAVTVGGGRRYVFVSGTAAIKGHASVGMGSLREQVECTLDNLRLVGGAAGVGEDLGLAGSEGWTRHFKIYLRREDQFEAARAMLSGALLRAGDRVIWLRSDICRAELDIEIEATLVGGAERGGDAAS